MRVEVVENLVTLINSRDLACGQEVGRSPVLHRQADSRLSQYTAHPREAGSRSGPSVVTIAIDWDTMLNWYQARAKGGNRENHFNPHRRQNTKVPQTNSNVPRRNKLLQGNEQ